MKPTNDGASLGVEQAACRPAVGSGKGLKSIWSSVLLATLVWIQLLQGVFTGAISYDDLDPLEAAGFEISIIGARTTTGHSGPGSIQAKRKEYLTQLGASKDRLPETSDWSPFVGKSSPFKQKSKDIQMSNNPFEEGSSLADVFPFKLENQTVKAFKVIGEGGAEWVFAQHNQTKFIFITDKEFKSVPAQVTAPADVMTFSLKSKQYLPIKSSALTVSTADGKYFNIEESLWEEILKSAPVFKTTDFPQVNIESSNAVNAKSSIYGTLLKDLVLEVLSGPALDKLWSQLATTGKDFQGIIRTSQNGYKTVELASSLSTKPDTYRVCVYCLFFESKRIGTHSKLFKLVLKDKQLIYEVASSELPESVGQLLHSTAVFVVADNQHELIQSHVIEVGSGQFLELSQSDLKIIVEMQRNATLNQVWLERVGASELLVDNNLLPLVVYDDLVFRFKSLRSVVQFAKDPNTEKALVAAGVTPDVDRLAPYYSGVDITSKTLDQLWTKPGLSPNLFVSSCKALPTRSWPYLVKRQGNIVQKYYLNLAQVRPAVKSPQVPGVPPQSAADPKLKQAIVELQSVGTGSLKVEPKSTEYMSSKPVKHQDGSEKPLTPECLDNLYGLKDGSLLSKYADRKVKKLAGEEREVYVKEGGFMVLNSSKLEELYKKSDSKTNAQQDKVLKGCLGEAPKPIVVPPPVVVPPKEEPKKEEPKKEEPKKEEPKKEEPKKEEPKKEDPKPVKKEEPKPEPKPEPEEVVKVIVINNTTVAKGSCNGTYKSGENCSNGTFEGAIITCSEPVEKPKQYNCSGQSTRQDFKCQGNTSSQGCNGTYETTIVSNNGTVAVKVKTSNDSKTGFSSDSNASGNSTYERREKNGSNQTVSKFACRNGSANSGKVCSNASFESDQSSESKGSERVKAECEGALNTETFKCEKGKYSYQKCSQISKNNKPIEECQGKYQSRTCPNGGTPSECFVEPGVAVNCLGEMKNGSCSPYDSLPIIKVNQTYWLRGNCSSKIINNSCEGTFNSTDKSLSKCPGNPTAEKKDYDACVADATQPFGSCQGVTNASGCHGKYLQEVTVGTETWEFKTTGKKGHFDFTSHLGSSKHTYKNPSTSGPAAEISKSLFCEKKVVPGKFESCSNSSYFWFDDQDDFGKPGMQRRKDILCPGDGTFSYKTLGCSASDTMTGLECVGRSKYSATPSGTQYTCLGNYTKVVCKNGGKDNSTCLSTKASDTERKTCQDSYFSNNICATETKTKGTSTPIQFSQFDYTTDIDGRKVKIAVFEVQSLKLNGLQSEEIKVSKAVSQTLQLASATQDADGSLSNIQFPRETKFVSFDEGRMDGVSFQNFLFDNIAYRDLAVSDDCSYVKLRVKEIVINNTLFTNLESTQSVFSQVVIQKLGLEQGKNIEKFGYRQIRSNLAFGTIYIRNAEIYLPYFSNKSIDNWVSSTSSSQEESARVPDIGLSKSVMAYSINITPNKDINLLFPKFTLENMDLDLLLIEDWVLTNHKLQTVPGLGEQLLKNYQKDERVVAREKLDAPKSPK